MNRTLSIIGIIVTIIYGTLLYYLIQNKISSFATMELNNIGDFLAGAFGPLAIFWLILGFFQQGKELQQSTKALELQAKELNQSVLQQKELVGVTRKQMEAELESIEYERQRQLERIKPNFIFHKVGGSHNGAGQSAFTVKIKNTGESVNLVSITTDLEITSQTDIPSWEKNSDYSLQWKYEKGRSLESAEILISYTKINGTHEEKKYLVAIVKNGQYPTALIT